MKLANATLKTVKNDGWGTLRQNIQIYWLKKFYSFINRFGSSRKVNIISTISHFHPGFYQNPFHVKYIDPAKVTHVSGLSPPRLYGVWCGGNWDLPSNESFEYAPYDPARPIEETLAYRGIRDYLFMDETETLFEHFKTHIRDPNARPWGHDSLESFDRRLDEIKTLRDSIQNQGFLTQQELINQYGDNARRQNNELVPPELNEIVVDIGRSGKPLHAGPGTHRLCVAKLLGINKVPVIVAARHIALLSDTNV